MGNLFARDESPKRTTVKDLFDEYQNLPDRDKIAFDKHKLRSDEARKKDIQKAREEMFETMKNITTPNGDPYFSVDYLKKILKIE